MTKKYISCLLLSLLFYMQQLKAQLLTDSSDKKLKSFLKFKVSDNSGFGWEQKISQKSTLELYFGMLIGLATDGFSFSDYSKAHLQISPNAYLEYRDYYNLKKRISRKKNVRNNSANFFYGNVQVVFPVSEQNFVNLLFTQGWGEQRSLGKKISFDYHLGVTEHFYYDKPPDGGYRYIKIEPDIAISIFYIF